MSQKNKTITIEVNRSAMNDATMALVYNTNALEKFLKIHKERVSDSIRLVAEGIMQENEELVKYLSEVYRNSNSDNIFLTLNDKQVGRLFKSLGDAFTHCEGEKQLTEYHLKELQKAVEKYEKLTENYDDLCGAMIGTFSNKEDADNG